MKIDVHMLVLQLPLWPVYQQLKNLVHLQEVSLNLQTNGTC